MHHKSDSASSYMLGKYCGTNAPAELHSSHNALYFWFRSDHSVSAGGFSVAWESQDPGVWRGDIAVSQALTAPLCVQVCVLGAPRRQGWGGA